MSEVPNAHEHLELAETAAHSGELAQAIIPLSIAGMAVIAAVFGSLESASAARAINARSTAAIRQGEATDLWGLFQANSTKKNMYELAAQQAAANSAQLQAKIDRYASQESDAEHQARAKEAEVKLQEGLSDVAMEQHHRLIVATNIIHLAIALASVSMVMQRRWLWIASVASVGLGVIAGATAYLL